MKNEAIKRLMTSNNEDVYIQMKAYLLSQVNNILSINDFEYKGSTIYSRSLDQFIQYNYSSWHKKELDSRTTNAINVVNKLSERFPDTLSKYEWLDLLVNIVYFYKQNLYDDNDTMLSIIRNKPTLYMKHFGRGMVSLKQNHII